MSIANTTDNAFLKAHAAFPRPANQWLQPIRDRAFQAFSQAGFPTVRDEEWKYTNLADVEARSAAYLNAGLAAADMTAAKSLLDALPLDPGHYTLVFANGQFRADLSNLPANEAGLSIETLGSADAKSGQRIGDCLGRIANIERFQLAALNTAFLVDGLVVRVSGGCEVSRPIHVIFISDGNPVSVQPRILLTLGEQSRAMLIEHYAGCGAGLTNALTEVHCATAAHLKYIKLQEEGAESYHLAAQHFRLDRDSRLDTVHVDLGARLARNDLTVRLAGPGASANLHGLFVVDGKRHIDNHTRLDHLAGETTSRESYRGILSDHGHGVFNGKIIVHPGADQSDAQLSNRNLLLSTKAEIDTKPELEIYTDEVKCGHGTTTGRLDDEALFYLRTRGVPAVQARRMLVTAFAKDIIDQISDPGNDRTGPRATAIAEHVGNALDRRLSG
jgi:Fe-S cluster assembly protein SufD